MCMERCQDLQPIHFVKQWTMWELTIQSSITHMKFSQNLSESPNPQFEAPGATERGPYRKKKQTWR